MIIMKNVLNMKLYAMCLSFDRFIQTGNTVYDAILYTSGHLWV
jgi:hypothetical protein